MSHIGPQEAYPRQRAVLCNLRLVRACSAPARHCHGTALQMLPEYAQQECEGIPCQSFAAVVTPVAALRTGAANDPGVNEALPCFCFLLLVVETSSFLGFPENSGEAKRGAWCKSSFGGNGAASNKDAQIRLWQFVYAPPAGGEAEKAFTGRAFVLCPVRGDEAGFMLA